MYGSTGYLTKYRGGASHNPSVTTIYTSTLNKVSMVQIEELPDDFEESMNLTDTAAPSTTGTPSAHADTSKTGGTMMTAPELPPALAQQQQQQQHDGKSPSELWASLNRTPLFMTSIDESDGAGGENVELEALKALAYEGPPLEVTANFKEQGNDCFREKRWKDAVEFYTKGLAVVLDERRKKGEKSAEIARPDGSDRVLEHGGADLKPRRELVGDEKEMAKMKEILLLNRAACNLELRTSITIYDVRMRSCCSDRLCLRRC